MPPSRLSTVFDLSGLRLHTDGSLVVQTSKNSNLRFSKRTVQDTRGSWIAKDAGGLASVPRYRKVASREDEGEDEIEEGEDEMDVDEDTRSERGKRDVHFKTSRARKRRKFATDEEYIAPDFSLASHACLSNDPDPECLPALAAPSSDLLKSVHYHASMYYHERGLLLNASKQYRKDRKARKLARLTLDHEGKNVRTRKRARSNSLNSDSEGEDPIDDDDDDDDDETQAPARRGDHSLADMYKTMDGSALMAIGMLLQEHVAELLYAEQVDQSENSQMYGETAEMNGSEAGISPPVDDPLSTT